MHMPSYRHATLACIVAERHLSNRTHRLRRKNHNTGGKPVAGRHNPREKGMSASAHNGAVLCTTPRPHLLTQPLHAWPTKVVHNRTHQLRQKMHDTGGKQVAGGDISQERKESQQVHKMGQVCAPHPMPQPLTQPSHAPPTKPLAQPYSLPETNEA